MNEFKHFNEHDEIGGRNPINPQHADREAMRRTGNRRRGKGRNRKNKGGLGSLIVIFPILIIVVVAFFIIKSYGNFFVPSNVSVEDNDKPAQHSIAINKNGMNIEDRYPTPEGYKRVKLDPSSFGYYLRHKRLKPYGEPAFYFNGKKKPSEGVYDSVYDYDIGDRDLHQCADAVMFLRADYLYKQKRYDDIAFNFVSGFRAEYKKWRAGYRVVNESHYVHSAAPDNSYESFLKYMNLVFSYAGTLSLEKELKLVNIKDIEPGDVFIRGGTPGTSRVGHAVIVVDVAQNAKGERVFMVAQSYMPAQQTQILVNNTNREISPWYNANEMTQITTPQWTFKKNELKRF